MKNFLLFLLLPLVFSTQILETAPPAAEAARLGGGRSFGGGPSFSRPMAPLPQPNSGMNMASAPRAGLGSGMGFLGPMLAGGLLGSLLFGGAFSGLQISDLIFILVLISAIRFFLRRRSTAQNNASFQRSAESGNPWEQFAGTSGSVRHAAPESGQIPLPAGFDLPKFMAGAKLMYARLQESWDKRELADISQFTAPEMFRLIKKQCEEDPAPGQTDILTLYAELYDFREDAATEHAMVYFDALLREYTGKPPENAREVWSFIRSKDNGVWKLLGIQQVEG